MKYSVLKHRYLIDRAELVATLGDMVKDRTIIRVIETKEMLVNNKAGKKLELKMEDVDYMEVTLETLVEVLTGIIDQTDIILDEEATIVNLNTPN